MYSLILALCVYDLIKRLGFMHSSDRRDDTKIIDQLLRNYAQDVANLEINWPNGNLWCIVLILSKFGRRCANMYVQKNPLFKI